MLLVGDPPRVLTISTERRVELRSPGSGALLSGRQLLDRSGPMLWVGRPDTLGRLPGRPELC